MTASGTRTALVVVDVQNDFCEGGALGVRGGAAVASAISRHLTTERDRYELVVASQDWHQPDVDNEGHIALPPERPDFRQTWPAHCVAGTPGAEFHPSLSVPGAWTAVHKGWGVPAYSAFEGRDQAGRDLGSLLHEASIDRVVVCGIATDYCVEATSRDAVRSGYPVDLMVEFTAAVDPTGQDAVVDALTEVGVRPV